MTHRPPKSVTQLLTATARGDPSAGEKLWAAIYDELRLLARRQLAGEALGRSRQTTSLVHEAYLRLVGDEDIQWANRRHFFAAAAQAMRRIRVDDARKRNCQKRGGGEKPVPLVEAEAAVLDQDPIIVLAISEAMDRLAEQDARKAEVVMLRYFAGLAVDECAKALGLSPRTVDSDWHFARAWLHRELSKGDSLAGPAAKSKEPDDPGSPTIPENP